MQLFYDSFWGRVKERLWINGMSMKTLAERLGEPYRSFTNRVSENRLPKKKGLVEAMARELGCSVEYLTTGKDSQPGVKYGPDVEDVIFRYRLLSEERKSAVRTFLRALTEDQEQEDLDFKRKHPEG